MLTSTSVCAVQLMLHVHNAGPGAIVLPADAAKQLEASPTYLSKIISSLAKADLVQTFRGAKGGLRLSRDANEITLLEIVEASQGRILGDYCRDWEQIGDVCGFHLAMLDLQQSIIQALGRHTLASLAERLVPHPGAQSRCRMQCVYRMMTSAAANGGEPGNRAR